MSHWGACRRSFERNGHFENLIEMGSLEDLAELDAKVARKLAKELRTEEGSSEEGVEDEEEEVSQKKVKGWRYAPFVVSNYGNAGESDVVELPRKENSTTSPEENEGKAKRELAFLSSLSPSFFTKTLQLIGRTSSHPYKTSFHPFNFLALELPPDFPFNWTISFAALSPLRLSVVRHLAL